MKKVFVLMILLFLISNVSYAGKKYKDVPDDDWYTNSVLYASNQGVIEGDGDTFRPNDLMTRAELAAVTAKLLDKINALEAQNNESQVITEAVERVKPSVVIVETPINVSSGFFIASDLVLTASHPFNKEESRTEIIVKVGRDKYKATIVKTDAVSDLTLLKIESKIGKPLTIGNSVTLGETVLTIGNPVNIGMTVSKGIISATNKAFPAVKIDGGMTFPSFNQIDMNINDGNSGGALFNAKGEVVGVISSKQENAEGVGFITRIQDIQEFLKGVI
jgi:S1-C subfamily serine protease